MFFACFVSDPLFLGLDRCCNEGIGVDPRTVTERPTNEEVRFFCPIASMMTMFVTSNMEDLGTFHFGPAAGFLAYC